MTSKVAVGLRVAILGMMLALVPVAASAQQPSGVAGVVKDTSGAVLPGVTVEAASPALIEKVRTVTTDGEGRYNIIDLRPGRYVVTFSLAGFSTVRREGIELPTGFTATVNADMRVGALEETITVTGAAPLVDTTNVRQQTAVSAELRAALPSGAKGLMSIASLVPGMTSGQDVGGGGAAGIYQMSQSTLATYHGKGSVKESYDGMQTNNTGGIGSTGYIMNPSTVVETAVETGGISAESNSAGLSINMIPREGGNAFTFGADATYTNQHLQGDNLSDTLRARGLTTTSKVLRSYDTNVTVGGPIKRDRLWFFTATRFLGTKNRVPGRYFNKTQGTLIFTPDLDRPQYYQDWLKSQAGRMTWQISAKNKLNVFADNQSFQQRGNGGNTAPEAHSCFVMWPQGLYQASWTSPVTNKILLEAGVSYTKNLYPCPAERRTDIFGFTVKPTDVSVLESSTGFVYNAASNYSLKQDENRAAQRFSASYVTGSHTFKAGLDTQELNSTVIPSANQDITYSFNRGVPTQITQRATPYEAKFRVRPDLGLFVQDRWTIRRLTINFGLRFDYFKGYVPSQHVDATRFVPARDYAPLHDIPKYTDLDPRMGVSYDLFGAGRTALKASLGRYVGKEGTSVAEALNPIVTSVNSVNRSWSDANKNYIPDCDLRNFGTNGECGAINNVNFGQINPSAVRYADDLLHGFGKRDYLWDFGTEVQHELRPGTSVTGGYYRNWTNHYRLFPRGEWITIGVADNQAVTPADFEPYCITAPVDPQLPGGGGYQVCGLYDVTPAKFGQSNVLNQRAEHYGKGKSRISNFFTANVTTRVARGIDLGASVDSGRTVQDECFVVDSPQALLNCRVITPFKGQTQIKVHGVYPLPGGFVVSGVLQNLSGAAYEANYAVSTAVIAPSLGRNLAACGTRAVCTSTATVPLIPPQTQFEPRRTNLDLRLTKVFQLSPRARLRANLDLYNVLNNSSILTTNNSYGASWRQPTGSGGGIQASRLIQFGGQLNF